MKNFMEDRDLLLMNVLDLIQKHNLTAYEIGTSVNLAITGVQKIIDGQTKRPQIHTLKSIQDYITENYEYIKSDIKNEVTPVPYDNYMVVEYADLSTAAGKLGVENPAILPEMKKRLVPKEFDNGNYLVVGVDGDSMDNGSNISIPDGTEILIKEYQLDNGDKLPIRNNLFVIVSKTGTVFKQITEHNTEEGYIICHSYNPKYKDFSIQLDDIIQIFIYRKIVSFRPSIPEITN